MTYAKAKVQRTLYNFLYKKCDAQFKFYISRKTYFVLCLDEKLASVGTNSVAMPSSPSSSPLSPTDEGIDRRAVGVKLIDCFGVDHPLLPERDCRADSCEVLPEKRHDVQSTKAAAVS